MIEGKKHQLHPALALPTLFLAYGLLGFGLRQINLLANLQSLFARLFLTQIEVYLMPAQGILRRRLVLPDQTHRRLSLKADK